MAREQIDIPDKIFEQLERVRSNGRVNMMARRNVQAVANDLDCYDLVGFIEDTPKKIWPEVLAEFGRWVKGREIDAS